MGGRKKDRIFNRCKEKIKLTQKEPADCLITCSGKVRHRIVASRKEPRLLRTCSENKTCGNELKYEYTKFMTLIGSSGSSRKSSAINQHSL